MDPSGDFLPKMGLSVVLLYAAVGNLVEVDQRFHSKVMKMVVLVTLSPTSYFRYVGARSAPTYLKFGLLHIKDGRTR